MADSHSPFLLVWDFSFHGQFKHLHGVPLTVTNTVQINLGRRPLLMTENPLDRAG